jgi:hypothetical protein
MAEKSKKQQSNKRKIISREPYKRRSEAEKQKIVYGKLKVFNCVQTNFWAIALATASGAELTCSFS